MPRPREVTFGDVVRVFLKRSDHLEPLTATEVGNELGTTRKTAYNRLEELADQGGLRTKKTAAKGRVWWPSVEIWYPSVSQATMRNQSVEEILARLRGETLTTEESELEPVVARALEQLDLPGSGEVEDRRREAIGEIYRHLQEVGEASRSELTDVVDPEELGYRDADSFWSNLVVKNDVLTELPGIITPTGGGRYYRFVGV